MNPDSAPTPKCEARGDDGQMSILLVGMMATALLLILGVLAATAVQLCRIQLLDVADAAALDAADAVAEESVYDEGLTDGVPLTTPTVIAAAGEHLATREQPSRVLSWSLQPGTGSPDGRTAVVRLQGQAAVPVISQALDVFGGSITVTVESRARSDLDEALG
ncbi:MAG: hypothetical protein WA892_04145 [Ornithinimicrobium sp.]